MRFEPDERLAKLAHHLTFVEQIEEDIARFKVRLEHIAEPRLRRMVMADIARLKTRRASELLRIVTALRGHDDLARRLDLVLSVPGLGERTALALIIRMPELGRVSREQAVALAGLAPFDDDSGKHKGERHIGRWPQAAASFTVRRRPAGRVPLEQSADRALFPPHQTWQSPQRSSHRLCQKALDLRQYRRPARHTLDRKTAQRLMVATVLDQGSSSPCNGPMAGLVPANGVNFSLSDHCVIVGVRADPKPHQIIAGFCRERAVAQAYPD